MDNVVSFNNITKVYRMGEEQVEALHRVSFAVAHGEFLAIMGASGSGKSTCMNIIGCLDTPSAGSYLLAGEDVATLDKDQLAAIRNTRLGFVFQGFNLLARTTARENVELPLVYSKMPAAARKDRAVAALTRVGLGERAGHYPNQLSGGQQQRVAIARALVNEPSIILADEPTGNLDTRTTIEVMEIFQRLNRQGITIIMVTHELEVARFACRIATFRDGRIIADGPAASLADAAIMEKGLQWNT